MHILLHYCRLVAAFALLNLLPHNLIAQQTSERSITAVRLSAEDAKKIRVDGALDETVWKTATIATDFRQREPRENEAATENTEVKVLFSESMLYIGVVAKDRNPEKIISRILQRDKVMEGHGFTGFPQFAGDDAVAILLDPFHDHRNAIVFATNPNGAEFEAIITDEGREFNIDWRAVWEVRTMRLPDGWSAEFAIPFRTLRYPATISDKPWGFNVYRVIRRKNEEVLWSGWSKNAGGFERVSKAGHLYGMSNLPRPGLNMEVKPFVLTGGSKDFSKSNASKGLGRLDAGLDVKWEVRPGLSLDMTLNTDFAQVEVDDEQVNLTRFELFLPEKRDFFLENAGIFDFGIKNSFEAPPFLMFFSRRIGIADDELVPVIGGARLTGRVGKQTVGLMNVVTEAAGDEPLTNFAIARVKRDVGGSNYVGVMAADRRNTDGSNTGLGLDATLWLSDAVNFQSFIAGTSTTDKSDPNTEDSRLDDVVWRMNLDVTKKKWGLTLQHLMVGDDAEAGMGFISRTGIRRSDLFFRVSPRPKFSGLRVIDIFNGGQHISDLDGNMLDWSTGPFVSMDWESGENLFFYYSAGETVIDESFEIADRVNVDEAQYDIRAFGISASTSRNRPIVFGLSRTTQDIFGGKMTNAGATLTAAAGSHLKLTAGWQHNAVDLPNGAFDADIGSLRLTYAFTTKLVANLLLQYNSLDNNISANFRLNFIHRPGSDLFLVLNENRGAPDTTIWSRQLRDMILKVTWLYRL